MTSGADVAVLVVVTGPAPATTATLSALAITADVAERAGSSVSFTIVDASGRPDVAAMLKGVDGATVVTSAGATLGEAWGAALAGQEADWVLLGQDDATPGDETLAHLVETARATPCDAVVAAPDPLPWILLSARAASELALADLPAKAPAAAIAQRVLDGGGVVARAAGAGTTHAIERRLAGEQLTSARVLSPRPEIVTVGTASYTGPRTMIQTSSGHDPIEIGAYCSIADGVRIVNPGGPLYDDQGNEVEQMPRGGHRAHAATTFPIGILVPDAPFDDAAPAGVRGRGLTIGDDVWLGYESMVLGPVHVGTGTIVGAGALVREDVPPYSIVAGVPAKVVKPRFEADVAERLQRIAWWSWPPAIVAANWEHFVVEASAFVAHFDPAGELPD